jgi:predicted SAM-dependent methyltransferase
MIFMFKKLIPASIEPEVIRFWYFLRPIIKLLFLGNNRYCPICNSNCRLFLPHRLSFRKTNNFVCPVCLSHNRHRLTWIYLNKFTNLMDGRSKNFLHIAPETEFADKFKHIKGLKYFSADLESPHAMIKMDISQMGWHESTFDIVFCSHVLEHVSNDHKAMREIFRVLKPNGWAMIQVPLSNGNTIEDPTVTDPIGRERMFGQSDHVRLYGIDIKNSLETAGFKVELVYGHQLMKLQDCEKICMTSNKPIFHCWKPDESSIRKNTLDK